MILSLLAPMSRSITCRELDLVLRHAARVEQVVEQARHLSRLTLEHVEIRALFRRRPASFSRAVAETTAPSGFVARARAWRGTGRAVAPPRDVLRPASARSRRGRTRPRRRSAGAVDQRQPSHEIPRGGHHSGPLLELVLLGLTGSSTVFVLMNGERHRFVGKLEGGLSHGGRQVFCTSLAAIAWFARMNRPRASLK